MTNLRCRRALAIAVSLTALAGCAGQSERLGSVQNRGDVAPRAFSEAIGARDYTNLSQGEAAVLAVGNWSELAVPNLTTLEVTRTRHSGFGDTQDGDDFQRDCDLDDDGIDDISCPAVRRDGQEQEYFDLASFKFLRLPNLKQYSSWASTITIDVSNIQQDHVVVDYALIAINNGNVDFEGDLRIVERLPGSITLLSFDEVHRVEDQRSLKQGLSLVPYIGLITLGMSNFPEVGMYRDAEISRTDDVIEFTARDLMLAPQEGLKFIFSVRYPIPGKATS